MAHPFDELLSFNQFMEVLSIKEVLEMMKPTVLTHKEPEKYGSFWVFWNGEDSTLSSDVMRQNIVAALSRFRDNTLYVEPSLVQFWAPVTINGQRLLTTVNQPFAFSELQRGLCKYRADSLNCKFNLDEEAQVLPNCNYARVFLSGLPEFFEQRMCNTINTFYSTFDFLVLPVFEPFSASPVGVLEFTCSNHCAFLMYRGLAYQKRVLKDVNLTTFDSRDYLECQNIQGLQSAKDEIEKALEIICHLHNLTLGQVWIEFPYMDDNNVPCTSNNVSNISYLKSIKEEFALKVVEYYYQSYATNIYPFKSLCDILPLRKGQGLVGKSLLAHKPYFCKNIMNLNATDDPLMCTVLSSEGDNICCFTICIRSIYTGSLDYVLQFIWPESDNNNKFLLNSIVAAMKRHLPTFKVSSGEELGEELFVQCIEGSMNDELSSSEICITTKPTPIPESFKREGEAAQHDLPIQQLIAEDTTQNCEDPRTAKISLSLEDIKRQFGKSMDEAADSLGVSRSALKRECRKHGIERWPARKRKKVSGSCPASKRKKVSSSCSNLRHEDGPDGVLRGGEDIPGFNGGELPSFDPDIGPSQKTDVRHTTPNATPIQNTSIVRSVIIEATYGDDTTKFHLSTISGMTDLRKAVTKRLPVSNGLFKIKYKDHKGKLILIVCDEDLQDCISRPLDEIKILVMPITNQAPRVYQQGNEEPISKSSLKNSDSLQDQAPVANAHQIPNVTTIQGTGMATVRATFQDYILKFQISFSSTRADLLYRVTERLSLEGGSLSMEYRDEDNEYILIGCDADMLRCMGSLTSSGKTTTDVRIKLIASEILPSLFKSSPDLTENGGNNKQKLINKLKDDIEVKEESKKRKKAIVKEEVNKVNDVTSTGREDVQENVENIGTHPLSCDDGQRRKVLEQFIFDQTRDPNEILVETGTEFLYCKHIRKLLSPKTWIDDDVINTAASLLTAEEERRQQSNPQLRRSWFLPTYVYEKLRTDEPDFGSICSDFRRYMGDVSLCNKIFIPINEMKHHWYMCRIDLMNGVIELLDSLPHNELSFSRLDEVTKLRDLFAELLDYTGATTYGAKVRRLRIQSPKWVPNQRNGWDCGLFVIKFMREEYGPHSVPANGEGHDSITERVKLAVYMVLHETNIHREIILQQVQPF